ncbi:hypothetical protein HYQ45_013751 [Verticillium longisporum]|uniref:Uncharacterized protein n=1 Tax=Verticillium longisporum TaxID=100787 RepID=A0A8I2ZDJ3_VERLO|nr:hypothetical protein HYQ45_013751 [Verticillium longisporum]
MLYVAGEVRLAGVWEALLPSIPPWLTWIIFAWCSGQHACPSIQQPPRSRHVSLATRSQNLTADEVTK